MSELKEYILLPRRGFLNEALRELEPVMGIIKTNAPFIVKPKFAGGKEIQIIHSIMADGPKLVKLDDLAAGQVKLHPDVRALPVIKYARPLTNRQLSPAAYPLSVPKPGKPKKLGGRIGSLSVVTIKVKKKKNKGWVPVGSGFRVVAFTDFLAREGDEGYTDDSGEVVLRVSGNKIERLCCELLWGWGAFQKNVPIKSSIVLKLEPVSVDFTDCVRQYYGQSRFNPATCVTVGVIDSGVGPHDDLNVVGGYNTVINENHGDYQDGDLHGTFVAGLIGSLGNLYPKLRGLSPGVRIQSYRVFGGGPTGTATNYTILHAMIRAQFDKCDILNLSIEDPRYDDVLRDAITDARENGMLVVVAAGNDGRKDVKYPAAYPGATAVSAMGCEGTFPTDVLEEITVLKPPYSAKDPNEFIASFSNIGDQIAVTGIGVGVLSTIPKNLYGSCSGTSMAAPVVTGAAASLLSQNSGIYHMPPNRARSDAVEQLLFKNCVPRGFGPSFEGHGMPDPQKV